jgi:hypothetical protein
VRAHFSVHTQTIKWKMLQLSSSCATSASVSARDKKSPDLCQVFLCTTAVYLVVVVVVVIVKGGEERESEEPNKRRELK